MDASRTMTFGSFELDVQLRQLRTTSSCVRLQPQPLEILRLLLEHPGEVVTREQLRCGLWPQGTYVDYEHSLNAAVKRLRAALGDAADNPRFVETVPRHGYRFIAGLDTTDTGESRRASILPRVAVLPFMNLSDDPAQGYFIDGLAEEMMAQLGSACRGRIAVVAPWLSTMRRDTWGHGSPIGETRPVHYLVEGGVRRNGDRVRITARIVEFASETHLWSDVFERDVTDCLSVQAQVAEAVARALAFELREG